MRGVWLLLQVFVSFSLVVAPGFPSPGCGHISCLPRWRSYNEDCTSGGVLKRKDENEQWMRIIYVLRPCLGMDSMLGLFFVQKVQRLEVFLFPRSGKEEGGSICCMLCAQIDPTCLMYVLQKDLPCQNTIGPIQTGWRISEWYHE